MAKRERCGRQRGITCSRGYPSGNRGTLKYGSTGKRELTNGTCDLAFFGRVGMLVLDHIEIASKFGDLLLEELASR